MNEEALKLLIEEIRQEFGVSPYDEDSMIITLINEAEYDINNIAGATIDYCEDLTARALLKNYVNYRRHGRIAEFKEVYAGEYTELQIKYFNPIIS